MTQIARIGCIGWDRPGRLDWKDRLLSTKRVRVAAYGLCLNDDQLLLTRAVVPDGTEPHWALPGGGLEHAEDPLDAVVREFAEETGYRISVDRLLGVDSRTWHSTSWGDPDGTDLHSIGIFYQVTIIGGELRNEVGGSTDQAAWIPFSTIPDLPRSTIVEIALELHRTGRPDGHPTPVPTGGLLRI